MALTRTWVCAALLAGAAVATAGAREPYDSIAEKYYASPQFHAKTYEELEADVERMDPTLHDPGTNLDTNPAPQ
jgi:hypothetical protein